MKYYNSRDRDPSLPNPGSGPLGPHRIRRDDHEAIVASTDVHALAMLRGYLNSYLGVTGLVILSAIGTVGALALGWLSWALVALFTLALSANAVVQTRRRAAQWLSIVDARIDELNCQR